MDERQLNLWENKETLKKEKEIKNKEKEFYNQREKEREELTKVIKACKGVIPLHILNWLKQQNFKTSTRMKDTPHAYIVKDYKNRLIFEEFAIFIRIYGYPEKFWSKEFLYYNIDGFKYWTMGNPLEETIIINRAEIKNVYG